MTEIDQEKEEKDVIKVLNELIILTNFISNTDAFDTVSKNAIINEIESLKDFVIDCWAKGKQI